MTRIEALTRLTEITEQLNADELEVLTWHARKILNGSKKHGAMDLDTDRRDFLGAEIRDELMDAACYFIMGSIREQRRTAVRPKTDPVMAGLRELRDSAPELPPVPEFDGGGDA